MNTYKGKRTFLSNPPTAIRLDEASTTITYVGEAKVGTTEASAKWRIFRLTDSSGDLTIEYADGDDKFDNVWANRASLSYS
jgi:hypothetical protein